MKPPTLLFASFALFAVLQPTQHLAAKPNVLLILVDDLKPALGCYGDKLAKTPNIDRLASRGTRFELAYCNQAVCAPSRFTLMLGSRSTSTGLYNLGSRLRSVLPNAVTIPQHFAKHGYRTESLGKIFHIGHGNQGDPESFSVPHFKEYVIEYADPASKPEGKITREEAMFRNIPPPKGGYNALHRGAAYESPDVCDDAYADGRVAAETIRRLEAAKGRNGKNFFIAAGFARPHLPFSAPKKYWDLFDPADFQLASNPDLPKDSPKVAHKRGGEIRNYFPVPDKRDPAQISDEVARNLIHGYYASTSYVDAQIGKVLDALDKLGLAKNTLVVLWGDHGFHLGDLGIWTKHTNYEQANRIPILFAGPGVPAGQSSKQLAESVDIYPTLAELAGLPAPKGPQPIDGLSLVPVLQDPCKRIRNHAFHCYPRGKIGRAIRTERYRMVEWKGRNGDSDYELYDYQTDPLESQNHAASQPAVLAKLQKVLSQYPEAVPSGGRKKAPSPGAKTNTPKIANKPITITAEVLIEQGKPAHGVILAQGGNQHGYALHFIQGQPAFDVRINRKATRLLLREKPTGKVSLTATLGKDEVTLAFNNSKPAQQPSHGLIPVQPMDALSIGHDSDTAAGNYNSPNPFNQKIVGTKVTTGK